MVRSLCVPGSCTDLAAASKQSKESEEMEPKPSNSPERPADVAARRKEGTGKISAARICFSQLDRTEAGIERGKGDVRRHDRAMEGRSPYVTTFDYDASTATQRPRSFREVGMAMTPLNNCSSTKSRTEGLGY